MNTRSQTNKIHFRTTRNKYQQLISEYTKRRNELRKQYPNTPLNKSKEYGDRVKRLSQRIQYFKKRLRHYQALHEKINEMAMLVCEYLDLDITHEDNPLYQYFLKIDKHDTSHRLLNLARGIFCKYARENIGIGYSGIWIDEYMGYTPCQTRGSKERKKVRPASYSTRIRARFVKSFYTNPYNHQQWRNFLNFVQEKQADQCNRKVA
jgi:hypothetical protein